MRSDLRWDEFHDGRLHVLNAGNVRGSSKIAAYDMDGTIITTKSGRVFPVDSKDWRLLYENRTVKKLQTLYNEGYKIVIITNQAGLASGKLKLGDFQSKVEGIVKALNGGNDTILVPIQLFCSAATRYKYLQIAACILINLRVLLLNFL